MASRSLPTTAPPTLPGRGTSLRPGNRFATRRVEHDVAAQARDEVPLTRLHRDRSREILSRNRSPDVGLEFGLNPYRGCEHGCVYCFARPSHEYLGFDPGLDFESRIAVKAEAPARLRERLASPRWRPAPIMLSGNTDAWQPSEERLEITRRCLAVLAECRNPVAAITKSRRIVRDLDLLQELARHDAVAVTISLTTLRRDLQRIMEPRASSPRARLDAVQALADAGIPVGVNLAPVIPGLTDVEIPTILEAAARAGATWAGYILLRLPHGVKELFDDWLDRHLPDRRQRILSRLRDAYGGRLYDARFGVRGRGSGSYAGQIRGIFDATVRKMALDTRSPPLSTAAFRAPAGAQLTLDLS
jgi:DNA repair photolyase